MPIPAYVLIGVGLALGLAGLVYLLVKAVALMKAARKAGIHNMADVQEIVGRVQRLEPRFREFERRQAVLAENLQRLQDEIEVLNYLKQEFDEATGNLSDLKSS